MRVLLVGSGAREHAIAKALARSRHEVELFCFAASRNPGILGLSKGYALGAIANPEEVSAFADLNKCDFCIIGPEAPLEQRVVDALLQRGIPSIGPRKNLAQIETSKGFARDLLKRHGVSGLPRYSRFTTLADVADFIESLHTDYVVKADGLMGGKGVKVYGEHLHSLDDTLQYCKWLINNGSSFVVEEKFTGQEFSLMSFSDGTSLAHMPPVQDYKRAYENDMGPNTGGMGCIMDANNVLPFLEKSDIAEAQAINEATVKALKKEFGVSYQGVLYGGFMATADGVKLIEYNARFGDPESIAVLSLLETDFMDICLGIIKENLGNIAICFQKTAAVCKYLVPTGYPDSPITGKEIEIGGDPYEYDIYFGAVEQKGDRLYETGSRTIAVLAKAPTIEQAGQLVEEMMPCIKGPLFHRADIGTAKLMQKRIEMMRALRTKK